MITSNGYNLIGFTSPSFTATSTVVVNPAATSQSIVVNSTSDTDTTAGVVTLRDAIAVANTALLPTVITFDPTVFATAQTISLAGSSSLQITNTSEATTIIGPAAGVTVTLNLSPTAVSSIADLKTASGAAAVSISNVTFTGSNYGIYASGTLLNLTNVTLTGNNRDNLEGGGGAGIYVNQGVANLNSCTVSDNTADYGGGIFNYFGTLTLIDSTVADNVATGPGSFDSSIAGGGITGFAGSIPLIDSTISGNSSAVGGGGIGEINGATLTLGNTIIAANTAPTDPDIQFSAGVTSNGNNLIGDGTGSSGLVNGTNNDQVGTAASPIDPGLGSLANNGGLTDTLLPAGNSPALGTGSIALIPTGVTMDQRGDPRTASDDTVVDIGSVEVTQSATPTAPTVTASTASLPANATTLTIAGTGFDPTAANDTVTFNDGAVGTVTAATTTSLTVSLSTDPTTAESLTAIVTADGQPSASEQVASVIPVVSPMQVQCLDEHLLKRLVVAIVLE